MLSCKSHLEELLVLFAKESKQEVTKLYPLVKKYGRKMADNQDSVVRRKIFQNSSSQDNGTKTTLFIPDFEDNSCCCVVVLRPR